LTRENVMREAANIDDLELPMLLPGIRVSTSPTEYYPIRQTVLRRFDGKAWVRLDDSVTAPHASRESPPSPER
jgi:branched-chain amino acid transport system substrate-binding protein